MVSQNMAILPGRTKLVVPIMSFVGNSGSGKTTLLEGVVRELKRLGYRVAVVKHAPHGFDIDQPKKDSWRFTQAGSDIVVLSSPERVSLIERVDMELTLTQIKALIGDKVDIVLVEGYKNGNSAKVVVLDGEQGHPQPGSKEEPLATISAHLSSLEMPQFYYDDIVSVVNLLIKQIGEPLPI